MNKQRQFPKELTKEDYFSSPIWYADEPAFVDDLNKASDSYIEIAKKNLQEEIDKRNKNFGNKEDMGHVFHSTPLAGDPNFKELQDYIGATSFNLLEEMGYDLKNHQVFITEMWVQEFAKTGGGHHTLHTHWNGHISGFYFLKASEKTSLPIFEDPRPGHLMNGLPESFNRLVLGLSEFPGIGKKTAERMAFHLLKSNKSWAGDLAKAIVDVKAQIHECPSCHNISEVIPCSICSDDRRDNLLICVVEDTTDLVAFEKTKHYNGKYHVLGGVLSPLDGIGPE